LDDLDGPFLVGFDVFVGFRDGTDKTFDQLALVFKIIPMREKTTSKPGNIVTRLEQNFHPLLFRPGGMRKRKNARLNRTVN